ncbi:hypothetical protein ACHQM5_010164 [Ranunculus cassubicifolius]
MLLLRCKFISHHFQSKFPLPSTLRFITNHQDSSDPVKYIPQTSTNLKQLQTLNHSINLSSSKLKNKRKTELFSTGDGKRFIELESEEIKVSIKTEEDAEKAAITAIAARALTAVELTNKLKTKGFTDHVIEKVLSKMQGKGYINDYMYAETFSQSRWSSLTWGPNRIKQALQRKGVSESDAQKATKHVFESGSDENALGMSKQAMDHLLVQATKQWLRGQSVPLEKKKARLIRWLQYRGFNWGIINVVLKKLQSEYPS